MNTSEPGFWRKFCVGGLIGAVVVFSYWILTGDIKPSVRLETSGILIRLLWALCLLTIALFVYFLPALNAVSRRHRNVNAIAVLNLLLGWTLIGWVAAMVWSATDDIKREE
jgi:hypothetical protein